MNKRALITGSAGFIGSHMAELLLAQGWHVTGIDNFDPFYPAKVKRRNIENTLSNRQFQLVEVDIRDAAMLKQLLHGNYDVIVHLAAKAGVRPSIEDPVGYLNTNVMGTQNLLELARLWKTPQFVFASSSSVYGVNPDTPWSEDSSPLLPISPYASTKLSAEMMGHVYSHLYGIRFLALRFFTVYGPRQRPDLAINKFTRLIAAGKPVPLFGSGDSRRDYTYVADICDGISRAIDYTLEPYRVFNLGNNQPVTLSYLVNAIGEVLGKKPLIEFLPNQPGDVPKTWANIQSATSGLGYCPKTPLSAGLARFAAWFLESEAQNQHGNRVDAGPCAVVA